MLLAGPKVDLRSIRDGSDIESLPTIWAYGTAFARGPGEIAVDLRSFPHTLFSTFYILWS